MSTPRLEISLGKIAHNVTTLKDLYRGKGIQISAVTKAMCGEPRVAQMLVERGIGILADSRIANIRRMRDAGIDSTFLLLRSPSLSQAADVVAYADMSLNSDLSVVRELSRQAIEQQTLHKVILMVELGDLREGIAPADLPGTVEQVLKLKGIALAGIGTNLACFGGIRPDDDNMGQLSDLARDIETEFGLKLAHVSGGNSANHAWLMSTEHVGRVDDLRLGEALYLGCETLHRVPIAGLFTDAFTLIAEVIESRIKPSVPYGERCQNAAGELPVFADLGDMRRVILAIGSQDVLVSGLTPKAEIDILGASGDHTILNARDIEYTVGDEVSFDLNYGALLSAMNSSYVEKVIL